MATHDYVIANGTGAAVRSDLNNALAAIVSNNSSSSEPATKYAYQWWADTTTGQLKLRNSANNGWVTIFELDGTMLMEDGSAAAPGLAFASDLDTGIAKNGTNGLMISAGGTQRFSVSATEVNVNDTGAATDFRVESDTNTAMLIVDGSANRVGIGAATPAATLDVAGNMIFSAGSPQIQFNAGGPLITNVGVANTLAFFTDSSTERLRLDSSGRLLAGLTSSSKNARIVAQGNSDNAASSAEVYLQRGTATPPDGTDLATIHFADNTGAAGADIRGQRDGGTWSGSSKPGRLVFSTTADGASSPTERLRVDSSGRLLLGATAPVSGADANGKVQVSQDVGSNTCILVAENTASSGNLSCIRARLRNSAPNSVFSAFLQCDDSAANRLTLRSNGGLANYSANNANLSDRNAKKDISAAAGTWDRVKEWEIVNYRYKDQPDDADLNLGVIAQQVNESCPEVVTVFQEAKEATETEPAQEERLGVKEQQMHWMAIKALQEAIAKIETLETKVAALEAG